MLEVHKRIPDCPGLCAGYIPRSELLPVPRRRQVFSLNMWRVTIESSFFLALNIFELAPWMGAPPRDLSNGVEFFCVR